MTPQDTLRTVSVNGNDLHYLEVGTGESVVFVHGSLGDYRSWQAQLAPFAARYRVVAYSRRYHYPNTWPAVHADYTAWLHAADLAAFIGQLGLAPCRIVGSSYGALSALLMATQQPELARALVLGEPPALRWLEHVAGGQALFDQFLHGAMHPAGAAYARDDNEGGVRLFLNGVLGPGAFDRMPPEVQGALLDNAPAMRLETASAEYFPRFTCEDAGRVAIPTLLLTGERSPRQFHLVTDELERCLPDTERAVILGTSHSMHSGNPAAYNTVVLDFLERR